jgi:hypothetical protein
MSRRPASIFDRSSTSLIRSSNCEPQRPMASTASRCAAFIVPVTLQQLGVAEHAVQRRSELVAHVREELALRAGGGFRGITGPAQLLVPLAADRKCRAETLRRNSRPQRDRRT